MFKPKQSSGFSIVELLIIVVVIAILAAITIVGYNGIQVRARESVALSDLKSTSTLMQVAYIETGTFPTTLPDSIKTSGNTTLTLKWSGTYTTYGTLTAVQNGVLMAQTCQKLIDEGLGKGTNQGGQVQNYITGCGNWNHGSMQVTAWNSRTWSTPISSGQLLDYANAFTTSDTWNAAQIAVVKNFYTQLVARQTSQGGVFPVTSFWDSWATTGNGGIMFEPLPATPQTKTSYCVEAVLNNIANKLWHIGEDGTVREGPC